MPVIGPAKQTPPSYASGYAKSASESAHPEFWDGLVGAWAPGLGATGSTLRDVSGNKLHGEWTAGSPAYSYCEKTKRHAADFSDTEIQTASVERPFTFTFCCWVKIDYAASDTFARIAEHGLNNSVTLCINKNLAPNKFMFQRLGSSSEGAASDTDISGDWQHVAMKYDGSKQYIYVDGYLENTFIAGSVAASSQIWHFGRNSAAPSLTRLNGSVADIRYFNSSISDAQIKSIYLNPLAPFRQRRSIPFGITAAPSFNNWYARPGRTNRIVGSGVHV